MYSVGAFAKMAVLQTCAYCVPLKKKAN